jgi:hypothetical protein
MPARTWDLYRRIIFSPESKVGLDFGQELWVWDRSRFESAEVIAQRLRDVGRPDDDAAVLFECTHSLIRDVGHAAGGVLVAIDRFREAVAECQRYIEEHDLAADEAKTEQLGLSHESLEMAMYAIEEALIWARTLDDRLKRSGRRGFPDQGLIPALAPGSRRDAVVQARSRYLDDHGREARFLSGLNLHMQPSGDGYAQGLIRGGRLFLRFPDAVGGSIDHRSELTYDDHREAGKFLAELSGAVETLFDDLVTALETHLPERLRVEPAGG